MIRAEQDNIEIDETSNVTFAKNMAITETNAGNE
jgi:hypothetical protein